MKKVAESGRTLVEMLGVLAIMAVLSLLGLYGYRQAIAKMHANELIYEANKRAAVVSAQIIFSHKNGNLNEFTMNEFGYGVFPTGDIVPHGEQFDIQVTGVSEQICKHMRNIAGGIIVGFSPETCDDDNTITLTYNNDLTETPMASSGSSSGGRTPLPEDGPTGDDGSTCSGERKGECQVCNNGVYIDSDAVCVAKGGGMCVDGECKSITGCLSNGDCRNLDPDNCGNGECWCYFANHTTICGGPTGPGVCKPKTYLWRGMATVDGHTYISGGDTNLDYWSALNFCRVHNGRMMTIEEFGCEGMDYCEGDDLLYTKIRQQLPSKKGSTFTTEVQSSCETRYIRYSNFHIEPYTRACSACQVICVVD